MRADTILTIGISTVIVGLIMFMNESGFKYLPIPFVGLIIMLIAIVKQNDEHRKW